VLDSVSHSNTEWVNREQLIGPSLFATFTHTSSAGLWAIFVVQTTWYNVQGHVCPGSSISWLIIIKFAMKMCINWSLNTCPFANIVPAMAKPLDIDRTYFSVHVLQVAYTCIATSQQFSA